MSFGDFGLSTMNIPIKENVELHKPCSEKLQSLTTETQINRDNSSMFKGEIDMASVQHKVDRTNVLPFTALVNKTDLIDIWNGRGYFSCLRNEWWKLWMNPPAKKDRRIKTKVMKKKTHLLLFSYVTWLPLVFVFQIVDWRQILRLH